MRPYLELEVEALAPGSFLAQRINEKTGLPTTETGVGTRAYTPQFERQTIHALRIDVDFTQDVAGQSLSGDVKVYNLGYERRTALRGAGATIRLRGGYVENLPFGEKLDEFKQFYAGLPETDAGAITDNVDVILVGVVRRVFTVKAGADHVTTFNIEPVTQGLAGGEVYQTWAGNVAVRGLAEELINRFRDPGLELSPDSLAQIPANATVTNFRAEGSIGDELTRLLRPHNLNWYEHNGAVRINRRGRTQPGFERFRIDLGVPTSQLGGTAGAELLGSPAAIADGTGVTVRQLMNPAVRPGNLAQLSGTFGSGEYKVSQIATRGSNWTSLTQTLRMTEVAT